MLLHFTTRFLVILYLKKLLQFFFKVSVIIILAQFFLVNRNVTSVVVALFFQWVLNSNVLPSVLLRLKSISFAQQVRSTEIVTVVTVTLYSSQIKSINNPTWVKCWLDSFTSFICIITSNMTRKKLRIWLWSWADYFLSSIFRFFLRMWNSHMTSFNSKLCFQGMYARLILKQICSKLFWVNQAI